MKTWIFQDRRHVERQGSAKASWYVGWRDPDGKQRRKSCGPGAQGKKNAMREADRIRGQLASGSYDAVPKKSWADFRAEYEEKILPSLAPRSRPEIRTSLDHFERIAKPGKMAAIKTATIDGFRSSRAKEPGKKKGDVVSPATVNKDLRHLKAALHRAFKWGYLAKMPDFAMVKEPKKLPTFITPEDFAKIYGACDVAKLPTGLPYPAGDWWRGLLMFGYMTGWRISEILALRRDDLDIEGGTALTRAEDNKGNADARVHLHPVVMDHLERLNAFDPNVFPWNHDRTALQAQFRRIQAAAEVVKPCRKQHEHTNACYAYGFHDLRRAFATLNAERMTGDALQTLMRHASYSTTQRYVSMARQIKSAAADLFVPELPDRKAE